VPLCQEVEGLTNTTGFEVAFAVADSAKITAASPARALIASSPVILKYANIPRCTKNFRPLEDMAEKYFCGLVTECSDSGFGVICPQKSPPSG
jgi:hypothetical protein